MATNGTPSIPKTQTVALVRELGGGVEFVKDYPVPQPGPDEVLVKVLYTGVCQSDLHTRAGTAAGPDGKNITAIKLPHIGGHEGVGRIVAVGEGATAETGTLVGVQFLNKICGTCEYCTTSREQHCTNANNHLHHIDGSFQEYCLVHTSNLIELPETIESSPVSAAEILGPVLCAGVTAYKAVKSAKIRPGHHMVVIGAAGGLGHFAVQYGIALGAKVIGIDGGAAKKDLIEGFGATYVDFWQVGDVVDEVQRLTDGGAHAVVVTTGSARAYANAADMLRLNGTLSCCGIPPGRSALATPIAAIVIKGLRITGNLVGNGQETRAAVEMVRSGHVKPKIEVRGFEELPGVYERLEKGDIVGRVVLKVAKE